MTGIYKITNLINNKVYIGQAVNIGRRWKDHITGLNTNTHFNRHLQNAWNKYGKETFKFEIVEECSEDKLTEREQYWIDYYGGMNSKVTYNQKEASENGKMSEEVKQRISKSKMGIKTGPLSEEHKKKISEANKGKKHTEEWKQKARERFLINNPLKGRHLSEEHRRKISENNGRGNLGKHWSEETKRKISESKKGTIPWNKGKHHSEETKEKIRQSRLGKSVTRKPLTDEQRERLRQANLGENNPRYGVEVTNETKEKMRLSKQDRVWINNDETEKWIDRAELDSYLQNGYILGRKFKKQGRKNKSKDK